MTGDARLDRMFHEQTEDSVPDTDDSFADRFDDGADPVNDVTIAPDGDGEYAIPTDQLRDAEREVPDTIEERLAQEVPEPGSGVVPGYEKAYEGALDSDVTDEDLAAGSEDDLDY